MVEGEFGLFQFLHQKFGTFFFKGCDKLPSGGTTGGKN